MAPLGRPTSLLVGVFALGLAAGSCGEERRPAAPSAAEDTRAVATTIDAYVAAYTTGRGGAACAAFTAALRARDDRIARERGVGSCAALLSRVGPELVAEGDRRRLLAAVRRPVVAIRYADGRRDRVLATVRLRAERVPQGNRIELRREGGEWRISRPQVPTGVRWP